MTGTKKPQHVNYVNFISGTTRGKGWLKKSNVFTEFLIQS